MLVCQSCWETNEDSAVVCTFCKQPLRAVLSSHPTEEDDPETTSRVQETRQRQTVRDARPDARLDERPVVKGDERVIASSHSMIRSSPEEVRTADSRASSPERVTVSIERPGTERPPHQREGGSAMRPDNLAAGRRIVGILVTYSWSDEGQIFPVYEGHNRIGSNASQCEIAVPQDDTLSAINSHIIFRENFTICDNVSLSGTYVDGRQIEIQLVPLRNYARIRAGSTHWTFIAIEPLSAESGESKTES